MGLATKIELRQQGFLLSAIVALMSSAPAFAQVDETSAEPASASQSMSGDDIVVTATRTSSAVSRVPISISAYDQRRMDTQGVRAMDDVARLTPGVTFNRSGRSSQVSIRGITSTVGSATTAIYIDDTPTQVRTVGNSATNNYPRVFDLERVEILRGPQGTLFGASSQGGSIRFITPKPSMSSPSAYGRAEVSQTEGGQANYEAGIAYGAPIIEDKIGFRASAWYRRDGGYVDRYTPVTEPATPSRLVEKNVNETKTLVARFALGAQLGESILVTPSVYYQRENAQSTAQFFNTLSDPDQMKFRNGYVFDPYVKDRFVLPALLIEVDMGSVAFISNTSYFDRKFDTYSDYTYYDAALYGSRRTALTLPGQIGTAAFINTQKNFSQEARFQSQGDGPLTWVVGGFYSRAKQFQFQDIKDAFLDRAIQIRTNGAQNVESVYRSPMLPGDMFFYTEIDTIDEQLAGFAQADYELFDGFKVTAGARISQTKFDTEVLRDGPLAGGRSVTVGKQSETPITPKFGVSWQIDPANLIYASVAKGYRPGGAQAQLSRVACATDLNALGLTDTPATFNSDSLWSYEIGSKNRLFDNLIQIDASAYIIKWKDIQQRVSFTSCGGLFVTNQGSATSKGIDLSMQLRPATGLQFGVAVSYNHAVFDQTVLQGPRTLRFKGEKLPVRPFTLTLSGEYQFPVNGDVQPYARADYQYLAKAPDRNPGVFGYDGGLPAYPLDSVNNLRMRAGIQTGRIDLAIFADNVLNDSPVNYGRIAGAASTILVGTAERPRTFGIFASYRY